MGQMIQKLQRRGVRAPLRCDLGISLFRIFLNVVKNGGPKYCGLPTTLKIVCSCREK